MPLTTVISRSHGISVIWNSHWTDFGGYPNFIPDEEFDCTSRILNLTNSIEYRFNFNLPCNDSGSSTSSQQLNSTSNSNLSPARLATGLPVQFNSTAFSLPSTYHSTSGSNTAWVNLHRIMEFVRKLESDSPQTSPRRVSTPRAPIGSPANPPSPSPESESYSLGIVLSNDMRRVWVWVRRRIGGDRTQEKEGGARGYTSQRRPIRRGCRVRVDLYAAFNPDGERIAASSACTPGSHRMPNAGTSPRERLVPRCGGAGAGACGERVSPRMRRCTRGRRWGWGRGMRDKEREWERGGLPRMDNRRKGGDKAERGRDEGTREMARREIKEGDGGDGEWDAKKKAEVHKHRSPSNYPSHQAAPTFPAPAHVAYTVPRRRGVMVQIPLSEWNQLPITTDVDMSEPPSPLDSRPSSPFSPLNSRPSSPSPASTSLGKRVTSDRTYSNEEGETEQEEEERENEQQQQKRARVTLKLRNGGGGGGGGGGPPAHLWTDECVRNGDRRRAGDDTTIGAMPCQEGTCTSCDAQQQQVAGGDTSGASTSAAAGSSGNASRAAMDVDGEVDADADENRGRSTGASAGRKKAGTAGKKAGTGATKKNTKKKGITEKGWCEDPNGGPPLTKTAGNFFCALLAVWNSQGRTDLETVLAGPEPSSSLPSDDPSASSLGDHSNSDRLPAPSPDYDPADTDASYTRVLQLIKKSKFLDLQIIMALSQLALNVDSEIHQAALNGKSLSKLADLELLLELLLYRRSTNFPGHFRLLDETRWYEGILSTINEERSTNFPGNFRLVLNLEPDETRWYEGILSTINEERSTNFPGNFRVVSNLEVVLSRLWSVFLPG
ncbi:hypothetical protein B0H16DRAFT_1705435 [Mycena metata]|uniref:Uncharacterized protein n=1 Tax=Mycena metata TaxID=1033252 RepID=A0AAD7GQG1_9AGAR|nr:hypothetical protein B0H16DRAFT_1705435 [Mycena metata]